MSQITWLALGYNVPVNPSKNRVYVWRKLKEYGASYFRPGVAILPKTSGSLNGLRTLCTKIHDMGGEAVLADLHFIEVKDEERAVRAFHAQSQGEYMALMDDCLKLMDSIRSNIIPDICVDSVRKVMRQYRKIKSRDYFGSGYAGEAVRLLDELAGDIANTAGGLSKQLRALLD